MREPLVRGQQRRQYISEILVGPGEGVSALREFLREHQGNAGGVRSDQAAVPRFSQDLPDQARMRSAEFEGTADKASATPSQY